MTKRALSCPAKAGHPVPRAADLDLGIAEYWIPLPGSGDLAGVVARVAKSGDYVICLGAGNITQWAYALPGELKALR